MIKVFIGTDSSIHQKAEKVVEYSIKKNTTSDVNVQFIRPGWKVGPTGFTTHRYLIPELCNFEGYAIYLDVDMLVLGDIQELWNYKTPGKWCTTPWTPKQPNDDVSVIDCSAFADLPNSTSLKLNKKTLRKEQIRSKIGKRYLQNIPKEWNCIDRLHKNTKLLHYSRLGTQPWKPSPNRKYKPHKDPKAVELFFQYLKEAEENGY